MARSPLFIWIAIGMQSALLTCGLQAGQAERARPATTPQLSDALVRHFRQAGLTLRPEARAGGFETEWILENAGVGPRREIRTKFKIFPIDTHVAVMREYLSNVNQASVLNERVALAMFYPFARGKTSNINDCAAWSAESVGITERVLNAFRSYQPPAVPGGATAGR